jgi:predicted patatin/cPLA2 family phospholipase
VPNQHHRTALILSSGAMRGAYQCGVLKAFKEYDLQFDVVIGSSAGAYNGIRYLSNQMDICEEIYVTDLPGGRFINPRNLFIPGSHFLNLDYLVDEICNMKSRLIDMDEVIRSPSEFYITALEYDTMITRFFDAKKHDIHLLLKATAAIPFLYSGKVMINGKRYIDGGLLEPVPLSKAIQLGCKRLYVVMNYSEADGKASYFKQVICKMPGRIPRLMAEHDRLKKEAKQFLHQTHEDLSLTVIRPRQSTSVGRFTSDGEKLQSCIDTGYSDGLELIRSGKIV